MLMSSRPFGLYGDFDAAWKDAGNETGTMRGTARVVTGTDEASNLGTQIALYDTFMTRVGALVLGDLMRQSYVNEATSNWSQPTNGAARETKLLVQYQCVITGTTHTMTIPTLNPTLPTYVININARDVLRMDTPVAITQFITAFNAFVVAPNIPWDGTEYAVDPACVVVGLKIVGRNI